MSTIHIDKNVYDTINDFTIRYNGLIEDAWKAYNDIQAILLTKEENNCAVCDPTYIRQTLERIDNEFFMYFAYIFNKELDLADDTRKTLALMEADMMAVTELVRQSISDQTLDMNGHLNAEFIDKKMHDLEDEYLVLVADASVFMILGQTLEDINTFITMKKMVIDDLKRCIVTPVFFPFCQFQGESVILSDGTYTKETLAQHYRLYEISSFKVPTNFSVIIHFLNDDVQRFTADQSCLLPSVKNAIKSITISRSRSQIVL